MAVSVTWRIIPLVQTRPKRSVAPPPARFAKCSCSPTPVAFSAGSNDNITALTTVRPPAYKIVDSFRPGGDPERYAFRSPIEVFDHEQHGPIRGDETQRGPNRREHEGLDRELTDDARSARTEHATQGDFPSRIAVLA